MNSADTAQAEPFSRHAFTKEDRDLMNLACTLGITDAVEIACLVVNHRTDMELIFSEITECAFANRHSTEGRRAHALWVDALDARTTF